MFITVQLKDVIKIQPRDFEKDRANAVRDEIDRKYANKVLPDVGLCLCVFDLLDVSEGRVLYGDGYIYHKVDFTIAVFKPFIGESIVGRVAQSNEQGVIVSTGFFDDIQVPPRLMQWPSAYDPTIGEHFWASDLGEEAPDEEVQPFNGALDRRLHMQRDEPVRVRIEEEAFFAVGPKEPPKATAPPAPGAPEVPEVKLVSMGPPPYSLLASTDGAGLGCLSWWASADAGDEQEVMEE